MKDKVTNFHDEDEDEEEITKKKPKRGRKNRKISASQYTKLYI